MPDFRFNVEDTFIGVLTESSPSADFPVPVFLATRRINSSLGATVHKFSGFDVVPSPNSQVEQAVQAFFHYSYEAVRRQLVFADIQG